MANIKTHVTNAYQSTLSAELSSVGLSMQLADVTGLSVPFYLVIEPLDSGQREYVYITGLVGNTATVSSRYLAGSAAGSGLTHPNGSVVRMSFMSQHLVDINDRVDDLQSQINSLSDHGSLAGLSDDDHTQYYNATRHTKVVHDNLAIDHGSLTGKADDDHTQYYNAARHTKAVHDALALDHGALAGKGDDDHTLYVKADGTRAFTGVVSGVTPTSGAHLATKTYVDGAGVTDHGALSGLGDDDHTQYLLAGGGRALAGNLSMGGNKLTNLGLATAAADALSRDAGDDRYLRLTGGTLTGQLLIAGTVGSPGLALALDTNSGFFATGNDGVIRWAGNGSPGGMLTGNGINVAADVTNDLGSIGGAWRRLYLQSLYDDNDVAVLDVSGPTFIPTVTFNGGIAVATGQGISIPGSGTTDMFWPGVDRHSDAAPGSLRLDPSNGYHLFYHTSSERFKKAIAEITVGQARAMLRAVRGITYEDIKTGNRSAGFIAERVHEAAQLAGAPPARFVGVDKKGRPDSIGMDGMVAVLWALVRDMDRRTAVLEAA